VPVAALRVAQLPVVIYSRRVHEFAKSIGQLLVATVPSEPCVDQKIIDHVNHEQRIAVRASVNYGRERAEPPRSIAGKTFREVVRNVFFCQQFQPQLFAIAMEFEFLLHRA
jgi:hypothetical protein